MVKGWLLKIKDEKRGGMLSLSKHSGQRPTLVLRQAQDDGRRTRINTFLERVIVHEIHHPILFHANVKQMKQVKQDFNSII